MFVLIFKKRAVTNKDLLQLFIIDDFKYLRLKDFINDRIFLHLT